jgi:hypothetical protein
VNGWEEASNWLRGQNTTRCTLSYPFLNAKEFILSLEFIIIILLKAVQLQGSFGLLNEFFPFGTVSDAVLPICYFHPCYIALYIIIPSIFRSS